MFQAIFGPSVPAPVPTDAVRPLHFFDDTPVWRSFILYSLFVFDDVLDPEKLRSSLERLARRDGWRKLSARLRKDRAGALEYHFPIDSDFASGKRAPLSYSHVDRTDSRIADDPVASTLPHLKPADDSRPAVMGDPDSYLPLMRRPNNPPLKLDDYLTTDAPHLGLHVISFRDATLVTLYWPHPLFDAMGKKALLEAWILMLQGREDEIPVPHGADSPDTDFDPLDKLGRHPTEPHKLQAQQMSGWGLGMWGVGHIFEFIGTQETRMVRVPAKFVLDLHDTALKELRSGGDPDPFLTEGDVMCAWWTKIATSHLPRDQATRKRTVVLNNAKSLRKILGGDPVLLPSDKPYLSNAIGFINVLLPFGEVLDQPVSHLAAKIRKAIEETGTREQMEAFAAMVRASGRKLPPFFGDTGMHMITYSNWVKVRLFELDFSSAVVKAGRNGGRKPGAMAYAQNNQSGLILPNGFPIIGRDLEGNYWLSGYMNKGLWAGIEEKFKEL